MPIDLHQIQDQGGWWIAFAGGAVSLWYRLSGRAGERIREIAIKAIHDEDCYMDREEQAATNTRFLESIRSVNERITADVREIKDAVSDTNRKLDRLLLLGRFHIRSTDDEDDEPTGRRR